MKPDPLTLWGCPHLGSQGLKLDKRTPLGALHLETKGPLCHQTWLRDWGNPTPFLGTCWLWSLEASFISSDESCAVKFLLEVKATFGLEVAS